MTIETGHEYPEEICGYCEPRDRRQLSEGMVIAIEPFQSDRNRHVEDTDDGMILLGAPGSLLAQYEHSLVVMRGAPIILTQPSA